VRAINLVPEDQRRGASQSRTGASVYVALTALGLTVALLLAWTLTSNQVSSRKAELRDLRAQTAAAEREAGDLEPYRKFAALRESRYQTVRSLATSRFDWGPVMRKVALVLPPDVWLSSLQGTVAPDTQLEDATGGEASSLRGTVQAPALEVVGCTRDQSQVARTMARLRLIEGVQRVTLAASEKGDSGPASSAGASAAGNDDCRGGRSDIPKFDILAFFAADELDAASEAGAAGAPSQGAGGQPTGTSTTGGARG
jgi:Tfp pilus assembly protein PilN